MSEKNPTKKGDKMGETENGCFGGTVAQLKEWLEQFDDNDSIDFCGGEGNWGEFFWIKVNDKIVYES